MSNFSLTFAHIFLMLWIISVAQPAMAKFKRNCGISNNDACKIYSYSDLKDVERTGLDKKYILMNDIYADPYNRFDPIGDYDYPFTGEFEGNGYTIYNLRIGRKDLHLQALFARVEGYAVIRNLDIVNANVIAKFYAAVLVGQLNGDATIHNVVIKNPTIQAEEHGVGGLVAEVGYWTRLGRNTTITCCHVRGGSISAPECGGLISSGKSPHVHECSVEEVETGSTFVLGGLLGFSEFGTVENSYSTLNAGNGGLIGYSKFDDVQNCYATGNVRATANVRTDAGVVSIVGGGLIGSASFLNQYGSIQNSFAAGSVSGDSDDLGGLLGAVDERDDGSVNVTNNFATTYPPIGNRAVTEEEGVQVIADQQYFQNNQNQPMASWDGDIWAFPKNRYPTLKCAVEASAGGTYIGKPGKSIRLNKATAFKGARYLWSVDNDKCAFRNENVLHPVLSCNIDPAIVNVCIKVSFPDNRVNRDCSTVVIAKDPEAPVVGAGRDYRGRVREPVHLNKAFTTGVGTYRWTIIDHKKCSFKDPNVLHPVLTCMKNSPALVKVCLQVRLSDTKELINDCTIVSLGALPKPYPDKLKEPICRYRSCVRQLRYGVFYQDSDFGSAQGSYDEAWSKTKYALRLMEDAPDAKLILSVRRLAEAMKGIEELRKSARGFSNKAGRIASRCAFALTRDFRKVYERKDIISSETLKEVSDNLKLARAKMKTKEWRESVTTSYESIQKMMIELGDEGVPRDDCF